ncbi:SOS response-associated peptidase family protein [Pelomonas sp. APW6]|uniref:SOS response-associated peptidase family protein n=1 Tax=Roseateles subflavus TaxID=3053353 RepID=A0ABT7LNB7_9BURK|nr:SOS response-associated peptidase family protein [Pelomonas sp. APW6]MDL5034323.1 SOS response-associated peptidase family protein [Pelomonas sp. APW6]
MCYSALVQADYRAYVRAYGADVDLQAFVRLAERRLREGRVPMPKAMVDAFAQASTPAEMEVRALLDQYAAQEATRLQEGLFAQKKRLADAERVLASAKPTKKAGEDQRIASNKIEQSLAKLADLQRTEPKERDSRIFPGHFCPVMVWEDGRRVVKPMRYQCRPAGKPAFYDAKYPGTYNARRDNLEGFWKGQFGHTHGLLVVTSFFENVARHRVEDRELAEGEDPENLVLRFDPAGGLPMLVACLWSHWAGAGGEELLSFAAITDEPPPEVSSAGHDRCIVPIKASAIDAWLRPGRGDLAAQYAILDDRERPYYEHRLAA